MIPRNTVSSFSPPLPGKARYAMGLCSRKPSTPLLFSLVYIGDKELLIEDQICVFLSFVQAFFCFVEKKNPDIFMFKLCYNNFSGVQLFALITRLSCALLLFTCLEALLDCLPIPRKSAQWPCFAIALIAQSSRRDTWFWCSAYIQLYLQYPRVSTASSLGAWWAPLSPTFLGGNAVFDKGDIIPLCLSHNVLSKRWLCNRTFATDLNPMQFVISLTSSSSISPCLVFLVMFYFITL